MSRQELAETANSYLYARTGRVYRLDANHVGKLEQGAIRWPSEPTALDKALGAGGELSALASEGMSAQ